MGYGDKWRWGCDEEMFQYLPNGRKYKVRCGSTSYDGGVNQCQDCARRSGHLPTPKEDEGDLEWYERATDRSDDEE